MFRFPQWYRLVHRYYLQILVVAVATSAVGAYFSSKLALESDLAELLPDTFESVWALNRIEEEIGGVGTLQVVLESRDFPALTRLAASLEPLLLSSSFVNRVEYQNDAAFYKKHALLFLDDAELDSLYDTIQERIDAEKQRLNPLFVDDLFGEPDEPDTESDLAAWEAKYQDKEPREFYTNADSTVLVIQLSPASTSTNIAYIRDMIADVERVVATASPASFAPDMQVYYGGNIWNRLDAFEVLKRDIQGTAAYGFGGVFFLIVLYFRRLSGAILITVTLFFSLCWTFGLTYLVIGTLNTITGFLFVILFGLGIDYGIHAFARYAESRNAGLSFEASLETLVRRTGKALATTAITTSAAFFSLTFMDFKGFSDLGFIAGVGMLFALVAMVIVLPALITLFERFKLLRIRPVPGRDRSFVRREFRYARPILVVTGGLTLLAIVGFSGVDFEYDFTNLRAITEERALVAEKTAGVFTLSESPAVALADSREAVDEIVTAVREVMATDTVTPTVQTVRSVFSLVPANQAQRLDKIRQIRALVDDEAADLVSGADQARLEKLRQYLEVDEPFTWDDLPEKDRRQFLDKQGQIGNFVFIYPGVALRDGRNAIEFRNDIGRITTRSGQTYYASSSNIITAEMLVIMIREGRWAVALTFAVVFAIVFLDLRRLWPTVFVLTPLAIGVLWMGGIMFLLGMKLNFFNIVVFPSIIGIGVDNGVHIYHRYREEGPGSLYYVLRHTGWAITMTTLTTIVGYSGLVLATHPGLQSIGDLAIVGLSATYLTAIVVLTSMLQVFDRSEPAGTDVSHSPSTT